MKVDWYATMRIANDARGLSQNPAASAFFLPDGLPPVSTDPDNLVTLRSDAQVATLERLRVAGPEDFYKGYIAAPALRARSTRPLAYLAGCSEACWGITAPPK